MSQTVVLLSVDSEKPSLAFGVSQSTGRFGSFAKSCTLYHSLGLRYRGHRQRLGNVMS